MWSCRQTVLKTLALATAAGAPKMPAPTTPFTTPAVRSKRPMARTKPGREDVAGSTRDSTRREGSR